MTRPQSIPAPGRGDGKKRQPKIYNRQLTIAVCMFRRPLQGLGSIEEEINRNAGVVCFRKGSTCLLQAQSAMRISRNANLLAPIFILLWSSCAGVKTAPESFSIKPPIKSVELSIWRDGGSIGFFMIDATGKEWKFCVNGQANTKDIGALYYGGLHPTEASSVKAESVKLENELLNALKSYIGDHLSQGDVEKLSNIDWQSERTKQEKDFWHIVRFLKKRDRLR